VSELAAHAKEEDGDGYADHGDGRGGEQEQPDTDTDADSNVERAGAGSHGRGGYANRQEKLTAAAYCYECCGTFVYADVERGKLVSPCCRGRWQFASKLVRLVVSQPRSTRPTTPTLFDA
jgi:hypothetical protein